MFWFSRSFVAILLGALLHHRSVLCGLSDESLKAAYGVVAQIGTTMLGFVLAALATLMTLANSRLIKNMQKTGHYQLLLRRMLVTMVSFAIVSFISTVLIFSPNANNPIAYVNLSALIFSSLLLFDVTRKLWIVLNFFAPD
jgi:hypothetical protein